jgi:hypothetical protein
MFHFNTVTRTTYFDHAVTGEGLDHCFDCASEIFILDQYLQRIRGVVDTAQRNREIASMSRQISAAISDKRTLKLKLK